VLSTCNQAVDNRESAGLNVQELIRQTLKNEKATSLLAAIEQAQFRGIQQAKAHMSGELSRIFGTKPVPTGVPAPDIPASTPGNLFTTKPPLETPSFSTSRPAIVTSANALAAQTSPAQDGAEVRYLPIMLNGSTVLRKVGEYKYRTDNSALQILSPGLGYRVGPRVIDVDPQHSYVTWGHTVSGIDIGNGWIKVVQKARLDTTQQMTSPAPSSTMDYLLMSDTTRSIPSTTDSPAANNIFIKKEPSRTSDVGEGGYSSGDITTIALCLGGGVLAGCAAVLGAASLLSQRKQSQDRSLLPQNSPAVSPREDVARGVISPTSTAVATSSPGTGTQATPPDSKSSANDNSHPNSLRFHLN